jgi:cytoskeletal protein CcmA (bactofilin family)
VEEIYPEEQVINTLFGPGSVFKGDLNVQGLTRIDGDYIGTIQSTGKILLGQNGRFDGTLSGRIVVIGGALRGNVYSTHKVILLAGCLLIGNVYSPRLIIEENALVSGYFGITGNPKDRGLQAKNEKRAIAEGNVSPKASSNEKVGKVSFFGSRKERRGSGL